MAGKIKSLPPEAEKLMITWNSIGGFIPKAVVCKAFGLTDSYISRCKKFETVLFEGKEYITYRSVWDEYIKRKTVI